MKTELGSMHFIKVAKAKINTLSTLKKENEKLLKQIANLEKQRDSI